MAEMAFTLEAAPTLGGTDITLGANRIVERDDLALVSIATPLDGEDTLRTALQANWGVSYPEPSQASQNAETYAIRTAPDQVLMMFPHPTPDAEKTVRQKLAGAGYTTEQTDVWVALEIDGPDTLSALERLCPLDVQHFPKWGAARTAIEHMGALILRLDTDRFLLLSASSSAGSFLHAVETSYRNVAT